MPRDIEDPFEERDHALLRGVAAYVRRQIDALEAAMLARVAAEMAPLSARLATLRDGVDGAVGEKGDVGEAGARGEPGATGADGSIAAVRAWRTGMDWAGLHVAYQHRGGLWVAVADPEGAEPGTDGRWRCVANGIDDLGIAQDIDDPRRMAIAVQLSDGAIAEFAFRMAIPLHRGLWAEGTTYERGDVVARNGASLMCVAEECTTPPGEGDQWALMSSKGKPGSRGEDGARGLPGEKGEAGVVAGVADIGLEDGHLVIHKHDGTITLLRLAPGAGNAETSIS